MLLKGSSFRNSTILVRLYLGMKQTASINVLIGEARGLKET